MKMSGFWFVTPCSLVEIYRRFRDTCCLHHQATRRYNSEDSHLYNAIYITTNFPVPVLHFVPVYNKLRVLPNIPELIDTIIL
jgi:hypothetical protein